MFRPLILHYVITIVVPINERFAYYTDSCCVVFFSIFLLTPGVIKIGIYNCLNMQYKNKC